MPMIIRWLGLCCLMSFSTIIKLYGGGQINEIFVILFGLFKRKQICTGFFIVCLYMYIVYLYMYCRWISSYQVGRIVILSTSLTLPHFDACPKQVHGFPMRYYVVVFLCSVSSVKMKGDCSLC
jgi:hypothetical protein